MSDEIKLFVVFRVNNSTGCGDEMGVYAAKSAEQAERMAEAEYGKSWAHMEAFETTEEEVST